MKFKVGELAWSPYDGFAIIHIRLPDQTHCFAHGTHWYDEEGKNETSKFPVLLTVEEAGLLGHEPPKREIEKYNFAYKCTDMGDSVLITKRKYSLEEFLKTFPSATEWEKIELTKIEVEI